jgi:hypothetical protein
MKAMRNLSIVLAGIVLASLGCEGPSPVLAKPTWVDDVEPILRANCFHCHGSANPDPAGTSQRWDFYDLNDNAVKAIGVFTPDLLQMMKWASGKDHAGMFSLYVGMPASAPTRMPPPPAIQISSSDVQTLKNWLATGIPASDTTPAVPPLRGTRIHNKLPTAAWLVKPSTIVVSDGDLEQVLGKVTCQGADEPVLHTGTTKLPTGWQPPCTVTLFDGQDTTIVNLQ